jgi:large subunit ribosomal protein L32
MGRVMAVADTAAAVNHATRTRTAVWSGVRYPSASPMAVPKQKQSHSRTTKRRSQHKISSPAINACPQCHSPRRPHRVCPVCGTYAGRQVLEPDTDHHGHEH